MKRTRITLTPAGVWLSRRVSQLYLKRLCVMHRRDPAGAAADVQARLAGMQSPVFVALSSALETAVPLGQGFGKFRTPEAAAALDRLGRLGDAVDVDIEDL